MAVEKPTFDGFIPEGTRLTEEELNALKSKGANFMIADAGSTPGARTGPVIGKRVREGEMTQAQRDAVIKDMNAIQTEWQKAQAATPADPAQLAQEAYIKSVIANEQTVTQVAAVNAFMPNVLTPPTKEALKTVAELEELKQKLDESEKKKNELQTFAREHTCDFCGHKQGDVVPEATKEDKQLWIRNLMGRPFTKMYSLFGGNLKVTFRVRTAKENDMIFDQLTREVQEKRIPGSINDVGALGYTLRLRKLQMTASLVRVEPGHSKELPPMASAEAKVLYPPRLSKEGKLVDDVVSLAHDIVFADFSEPVYSAIFGAQYQFEQLTMLLTQRAGDADFWSETAG